MDLGYKEYLWLQKSLTEAGVKHVTKLLALWFPGDSGAFPLMYFIGSAENKSRGSDSGDALTSLSIHFKGTVLLLMGKTKPSGRRKEEAEGTCCWGGVPGIKGSGIIKVGKAWPGHPIGPSSVPVSLPPGSHSEIGSSGLIPSSLIPGLVSPR